MGTRYSTQRYVVTDCANPSGTDVAFTYTKDSDQPYISVGSKILLTGNADYTSQLTVTAVNNTTQVITVASGFVAGSTFTGATEDLFVHLADAYDDYESVLNRRNLFLGSIASTALPASAPNHAIAYDSTNSKLVIFINGSWVDYDA